MVEHQQETANTDYAGMFIGRALIGAICMLIVIAATIAALWWQLANYWIVLVAVGAIVVIGYQVWRPIWKAL